jgi:hypothetical protein
MINYGLEHPQGSEKPSAAVSAGISSFQRLCNDIDFTSGKRGMNGGIFFYYLQFLPVCKVTRFSKVLDTSLRSYSTGAGLASLNGYLSFTPPSGVVAAPYTVLIHSPNRLFGDSHKGFSFSF